MPDADEKTTARTFLVPDLGEGLESATIVEWLVAVGDEVALNQSLCTVETAKAEVDVPSPFAGRVIELGGAEGATLEVGTLLARIATAESAARQPTLVGYGLDDSIDRSRRRRASEGPGRRSAPGPASATPTRPRARPPVRKLARALGVDLAALAPGSGETGTITRADVEHAASSTSAEGSPLGFTVVPVRGVRSVVAERMTQSHETIPAATCGLTVDATDLLAARVMFNDALERRGRAPVVTPFSLLCHLLVRTLQVQPAFNSTFVNPTFGNSTMVDGANAGGRSAEIHVFDDVHLGFATATPRGLLVPVVRGAQTLGLVALSIEMARLAAAAREGTLAPGEMQGSTFTVSNFGALGLDSGIPIINPPEAAILGVGSIRRRPHVVDDEVVARATASLTLSFDHRVGDGAEAGALMGMMRELVESPVLALAST